MFQDQVEDYLYDGLVKKKKRGRKPGLKNQIVDYVKDTEDVEIINKYGTKSRPKKQSNEILSRNFFSSQPDDFLMFSFYHKHGSVLLLDKMNQELSQKEILEVFQTIFPNFMNCELKQLLETDQSLIQILKKNILLFSNPIFAEIFQCEKKNLLARSIAIITRDLFSEYCLHNCNICEQQFEYKTFKCKEQCLKSNICKQCLIKHLEIGYKNKCINNCSSEYDLEECLSIIDQKRFYEKQHAIMISYKRITKGIFVCNCGKIDEFKAPPSQTGFVQCPSCSQLLCVACGLNHLSGFCALLINEALKDLDSTYFKPCPHCGTIIERAQGCLHIKCINCQEFFCFSCGIDFCEANECYNPEVKWSIQMFYDYLQWKQKNNGLFRIFVFCDFFLGMTMETYIKQLPTITF